MELEAGPQAGGLDVTPKLGPSGVCFILQAGIGGGLEGRGWKRTVAGHWEQSRLGPCLRGRPRARAPRAGWRLTSFTEMGTQGEEQRDGQ